MAAPWIFRAARPTVCKSDVSERRNPFASKEAEIGEGDVSKIESTGNFNDFLPRHVPLNQHLKSPPEILAEDPVPLEAG